VLLRRSSASESESESVSESESESLSESLSESESESDVPIRARLARREGGGEGARALFFRAISFLLLPIPGRHCHSTLSLTAIGCHCLGIYTVILSNRFARWSCCHCCRFLSKWQCRPGRLLPGPWPGIGLSPIPSTSGTSSCAHHE
jgi:hypothetical protein